MAVREWFMRPSCKLGVSDNVGSNPTRHTKSLVDVLEWQTGRLEVAVPERVWRFESSRRHALLAERQTRRVQNPLPFGA